MKHWRSALCAFFAVIGTHALLLSVFFALLYLAELPNAAMTISAVLGIAAVIGWLWLEQRLACGCGAHRIVFPVAVLLSSCVALLLDRLAMQMFHLSLLQNAGRHYVYSLYLFLLLLLLTVLFFTVRLFIWLCMRARRALHRS